MTVELNYNEKLSQLNKDSDFRWYLVSEGDGWACESMPREHYCIGATRDIAVDAAIAVCSRIAQGGAA